MPAHAKLVLLFILVAPLIAADEKTPGKEAAADQNLQQGIWKPTEATLGGSSMTADQLSAMTLKLVRDRYELTVEGEPQADKGTCTLDASKTPRRMRITSDEGPNKGKTFLAIYEFTKDGGMRICYDLSGKQYPPEFSSPSGSTMYLVTYKRQKR